MMKIGQSAGNPDALSGDPQRLYAEYPSSPSNRKANIVEISSDWVVGFVDGEGCFYIGVNEHSEMKVGYQVLPEFRVVQHEKDIQVLHAMKDFFQCGVVRRNHDERF